MEPPWNRRRRGDGAELSGCIRSLVETAIKGYLPVAVLLATEFSATSWQESVARISISSLLGGHSSWSDEKELFRETVWFYISTFYEQVDIRLGGS